jgi:hypothetical protein
MTADDFMRTVRGAVRIPAGTRARQCKGPRCIDMIYDVMKREPKHERDTTPVSLKQYKENPPGVAPTETDDGAGINHFADCVDAPRFKR